MSAIAYLILQRAIIRADGPDSPLARAVGADRKGRISWALCLVAMPAAFVRPGLADAIFVLVALIWLIPDPRVERQLKSLE